MRYEVFSLRVFKELNPANSHKNELSRHSFLSWAFSSQTLDQHILTTPLWQTRKQRTQLSCAYFPDPQTLWDNKWMWFESTKFWYNLLLTNYMCFVLNSQRWLYYEASETSFWVLHLHKPLAWPWESPSNVFLLSYIFVKWAENILTALRAGASYTSASPPSYFLLCLVVWEWLRGFEDLAKGKLIWRYNYLDTGGYIMWLVVTSAYSHVVAREVSQPDIWQS